VTPHEKKGKKKPKMGRRGDRVELGNLPPLLGKEQGTGKPKGRERRLKCLRFVLARRSERGGGRVGKRVRGGKEREEQEKSSTALG